MKTLEPSDNRYETPSFHNYSMQPPSQNAHLKVKIQDIKGKNEELYSQYNSIKVRL
jgi:hypothetical protein